MRYRLKIEDCGADGLPCGESLCVIAEGTFNGGALDLRYLFDNSEYRLSVGVDYVKSSRFGETEIELEFINGQTTVGRLRGGGTGGDFHIFTHELKIVLTKNGCNARVTFSDGADGSGKVVKNITAYAVG